MMNVGVNSDIVFEDEEFADDETSTMTTEEGVALDQLYEGLKKHGLLPNEDSAGEQGVYEFLWEDFRELDVRLPQEIRSSLFWYTLIEEDGIGWVVEGARFVNRIGYFVSKEKLDVGDGIRYW